MSKGGVESGGGKTAEEFTEVAYGDGKVAKVSPEGMKEITNKASADGKSLGDTIEEILEKK